MVIYDLDNMVCEYTALYEQRKPKFLSYTSQLPRKTRNKYVCLSEMIELMKQLQLIVRIHNELLLRQEQYWREMDVVNLRMITDEENSREILQTNILIKEPRLYADQISDEYEILPGNKIRQKYSKSYMRREHDIQGSCVILS
ncbi:uncharacterized protein LOC123290526 [Chrysoperla carnea]|uniref:uncharacterized protein LOC123290526 n=1 Tax=Chrysoperla carnea TaxID=189513 RepID=UPI001D0898CB|nr:uncharacterized protein LOC123290526 [Chrysoperla carnea]